MIRVVVAAMGFMVGATELLAAQDIFEIQV